MRNSPLSTLSIALLIGTDRLAFRLSVAYLQPVN